MTPPWKKSPGKKTGHATGLKAERLAELALRLKGFRILARRYKTPQGEIDIVARQGNTLAFVEVKFRATGDAAGEAVHARNRARVQGAAALYLQAHPQYSEMDMRFDAVLLAPGSWPRHVISAWEC